MPLVFNKYVGQDTMLSVWKIEETEAQLQGTLQLRQHELEFISSLNQGKRLLHWLSTRVLLRTMLNTTEYIDCRMDEHGKPYLYNLDYEISLSHSYDYAAVMISRGSKVGVDIELIKPKIKAIKHKFLTDAELGQKQIGDSIDGLYVCWCAKEAIYKWHGKKGLEFRRHMQIKPFELGDTGTLTAIVELPDGTQALNVEFLKVDEAYMLGYIVA